MGVGFPATLKLLQFGERVRDALADAIESMRVVRTCVLKDALHNVLFHSGNAGVHGGAGVASFRHARIKRERPTNTASR